MPQRPFGRAVIALALSLACTAAVAQPLPPPDRPMLPRQTDMAPGPLMDAAPGGDLPFADPMQILLNSFDVQRDLGLTPKQLENLRLASRNFLTQMQDLMSPRSGMNPEQQRAAMQQQAMQTRPMINRELSVEQIARLQQILLQIQGPCMAIQDPDMSAQLGLQGPQMAQAMAACRDRSQAIRANFRPPSPGEEPCTAAAENRTRIEKIRIDGDARVLATFSPAQRNTFAAMLGRPLHLEPPMPPGCMVNGRAG